MSNADVCLPPDPTVSGWHWLIAPNGKPYHEPIWWEADPQHWDNPSGTWRGIVGGRPAWAESNGWRYYAPIPSPDAVAKLVEAAERSQKAIAAALEYFRDIDTCAGCETALEDAERDVAFALAPFRKDQKA